MSLINCKECGSKISNTAKFCPHCGYINKHKTSKLDMACLVFGAITMFYAMGSCLNDIFSQSYPYSAVPYVVFLFLICFGIGILSILKNKISKLNIIGLILGLIAVLLAIMVNVIAR